MLGVYFCRFSKVRIVCSRTWLGWFKKGHLFINAVYHTLKLNRQKRKWLWSQWATLKTNTSALSSLLKSLKYNSLRLTHSEILRPLNSQQKIKSLKLPENSSAKFKTTSHEVIDGTSYHFYSHVLWFLFWWKYPGQPWKVLFGWISLYSKCDSTFRVIFTVITSVRPRPW